MFLYIQDNIDPLVTSVSAVRDRADRGGCWSCSTALYGLDRLLVGRGREDA